MKYILLIVFITFNVCSYSQTEKDSLLERDIKNVVETMNMMHFLDKSTGYFKNEDAFQTYFDEHINGDNLTLKTQIRTYLNPKKSLDDYTYHSYVNAVHDKNALELINIIKAYGWPSEKRIMRYDAIKRNSSPLLFVMRAKTTYVKKIRRLTKDELEQGRIAQNIYDMIVWQASPERYDMSYLEENGAVKIIENKRLMPPDSH